MTTKPLPHLTPTGTCWCGCATKVGAGSFFAPGHDKVAEAALLAAEYGSSVAQLLHGHGYGPGHSVSARAVSEGVWRKCPSCSYVGAPASITNHTKKAHTAIPAADQARGASRMTDSTISQRADLEKAVRTYGGCWDTERGLRTLRDAGHEPQAKHTRQILRDLASEGLLVKVEDWPVRYQTERPEETP